MEASKGRQSLNIQGLQAMDLRTQKPDGGCWDCSKAADRALAKKRIAENDPDWLIGSPLCAWLSCWQNISYCNITAAEKDEKMKNGWMRLKFVAELYRQKIKAGNTSSMSTRVVRHRGHNHALKRS